MSELRDSRVDELEAVANGVIWLDNNIHNYGSDAWRDYFKAVLRDARRAMAGEQNTGSRSE